MERALRLIVLPLIISISLWILVFHLADRERPGTSIPPTQIRREVVVVLIFVAAWLLLAGSWVIQRIDERRPRSDKYHCAQCGYSLHGLPWSTRVCPECGRPIG